MAFEQKKNTLNWKSKRISNHFNISKRLLNRNEQVENAEIKRSLKWRFKQLEEPVENTHARSLVGTAQCTLNKIHTQLFSPFIVSVGTIKFAFRIWNAVHIIIPFSFSFRANIDSQHRTSFASLHSAHTHTSMHGRLLALFATQLGGFLFQFGMSALDCECYLHFSFFLALLLSRIIWHSSFFFRLM